RVVVSVRRFVDLVCFRSCRRFPLCRSSVLGLA
ncbi:hypothetical protein A2U01_0073693, partial [Trifolium medium]|nr:hypothetical protein [Trifolium medium]